MKLKDNQKKAIENIEGNYLVNAGAGTGKTLVLVERYLEILRNGSLEEASEIESIVAITFTKKAAQEMIERVRDKLREESKKNKTWKRLYRDIERANISTIHSFCSNILRENPIEAEVDPMFKVLEDIESEKLLKNSIRDILLEEIETNDLLYKMYVKLNLNIVSDLIDDIYYLYNEIRSGGKDFLELKNNHLNYINSLEIDKIKLNKVKDLVLFLMEKLRSNASINKLREEDLWNRFLEDEYGKDELRDILNLIIENLGTSKPYAEEIEKLNATILEVMKFFEKENIFFYSLIMDLLIKVDRLYSKKKREISSLDYDDLQLKVLYLFEDKKVLKEYQSKYKYIMIDEFQDTNDVQKEIFYKLCSVEKELDRENLFVVGDPKQSIYGFRGADLQVFYQVANDIKELNPKNIINLDDNFRTESNVMNFINDIFIKLMEDDYISLKSNIDSKEDISIEILEKENLDIPNNIPNSDYYRYYEADLIGSRIKELVDSKKYSYGDFALLFRSTTNDYIYEEALKKYNIPFYNTGGRGYFSRQEILDITNGLKSILSLEDIISNIGFLRSPMVSIPDTTIYKILREEGNIYEKIESLWKKEETKSLKEILDLYDHLYKFKKYNTISELAKEIISITNYKQILLLKSEPRQSLANLDKFISLIKEFEDLKKDSAIDTLTYIEELRERKEFQAKVESEQENVVKLLTIHKSKGLEFPVVIIPQMSSSGSGKSFRINYDKNMGIGLKIEGNSSIYDGIRNIKRKDEEEENKRILYVAMTRTEKLLILGMQGTNSGFKKMIGRYLKDKDIRYIENVGIKEERVEEVKLLKEELLQANKEERKIPINLYEDNEYKNSEIDKFSITQYLVFKDCNRKYFFKYYKGLSNIKDTEESFDYSNEREIHFNQDYKSRIDPIIKGNVIHDFCEQYESYLNPNELIDEICNRYGIEYTREKKEIDIYINNYIKYFKEEYEEVLKEKSFMIKIGKGVFTGAIDRINIFKNHVEIADYKTNRVLDMNYLLDIYSPQLRFYTYVVGKLLNKKVLKSELLFLENGERIEVDIQEHRIEETVKELEKFVDFVNSNHSISQYKCKIDCDKKCEYDIICKQD